MGARLNVHRRQVLRKINKAARAADRDYREQELTNHTGITVGRTSTTVPRHREIPDLVPETIFRQLQGELGEGWWRR